MLLKVLERGRLLLQRFRRIGGVNLNLELLGSALRQSGSFQLLERLYANRANSCKSVFLLPLYGYVQVQLRT